MITEYCGKNPVEGAFDIYWEFCSLKLILPEMQNPALNRTLQH